MNTVGWLSLAAALALAGRPRGVSSRAVSLAGGGRLVAVDEAPGLNPGALPWRPALAVGAATTVAAVAVVAGAALALAAAAVLATSATLVRDAVRARRTARHERTLLACVGVLVGELQAGAQPSLALASAARAGPAGPVTEVFGRAADVARQGGEAGSTLRAGADPSIALVGLAWSLGSGGGAALADVVGRVRADLAAAGEQRRAVAVTLAGPRSSAALLSALPLLGIGLGVAMGARPVPFLLDSPAGRVLCCAGVLLDAAGVLWMRRILRRAAGP